jgi:RimJ/RimL family protein N-acetyltransferase
VFLPARSMSIVQSGEVRVGAGQDVSGATAEAREGTPPRPTRRLELTVVTNYCRAVGTRLGTARLIIRTFEDRDADAWIAMFSDPEVVRFLGPPTVPTMQTFQGAIESRHAMERDIGYAMWAVEDRMTGGFIGQCGLRPASSMDKDAGSEIDLGYHFVTAGWNKGYATEAAVAVLAHGFEAVGLQSIMAVAVPENVGSWRVMEKAGMRYSRLVDLYGFRGLKQYLADREWWSAPTLA